LQPDIYYSITGLDYLDSPDDVRFFGKYDFPIKQILPSDLRIVVGEFGKSDHSGFGPLDLTFLLDGIEAGPMFFVTPVPEPGTIVLTVIATLVCAFATRRRMHR
jgi:hypothetical protein